MIVGKHTLAREMVGGTSHVAHRMASDLSTILERPYVLIVRTHSLDILQLAFGTFALSDTKPKPRSLSTSNCSLAAQEYIDRHT